MFFLIFPAGVSQGFATVTLPFLLSQSGFSVSTTAGIVALAVSANLWRFVMAPLVDMSLSLKKWYLLALTVLTASLVGVTFIQFNTANEWWITWMIFASQIACNLLILPIGSFMARCIPVQKKGAASGWYQAGSLAGMGLGGGAGIWLSNHYSIPIAGISLGLICLLFAAAMFLMKDIKNSRERTFLKEFVTLGKDIVTLIKIPAALFTIFIVATPIGTGATTGLWSAIASEWKVDADTVALITGLVSGGVSVAGCLVGGYMADKIGAWRGYMVAGGICAVVALVMALLPYTPAVFIGGVLVYTFGIGLINACFSAVILLAIGKQNAATKYSLLSSLGNLPVVYMTAINGWSHDTFSTRIMLVAEAGIGVAFILLALLVMRWMLGKQLLKAVE